MTVVLIMASGQQRRFRSAEHKQLLKAHDETLLQRMGRQCIERGVDPSRVVVITHHLQIKRHVRYESLMSHLDLGERRHEKLAGSMAATRPIWGDQRIIVLLGDVYYTNRTMDVIHGDAQVVRFFGDPWETYAMSVWADGYDDILKAMACAVEGRVGKMRKVYQCYVGVSTDGNSFEPGFDIGNPSPGCVWRTITDETRDFDDVSQYHQFEVEMLNQYARGRLP